MALLIGIDLGTTGCKAVVYDERGIALGESYLEYGLITLSATMVEQDPHAWWDLTLQAVNAALDAAAADRSAVRGIAVSSQGISFVLLDEDDRPLGNAINWLDGRATAECDDILARYRAETLFRAAPASGLRPSTCCRNCSGCGEHAPEKWRPARRLLMGHDYLVYRLCGAHVTDHSLAGGTLLYDLAGLDWSAELLDAFDIPRRLLPEVRWAGTPVGTLKPEVADALGLRREVVVAVGGQDQKCAALGAGIDDRTATVSLGTASAIEQLMASPATDPAMRIPTFTFLQPARWVLEGVVGTAAVSMRWLRDMLGADGYAGLDAAAAAVPAGSDGVRFYPHLSGAGSPHWNVDAARLVSRPQPGHLARAPGARRHGRGRVPGAREPRSDADAGRPRRARSSPSAAAPRARCGVPSWAMCWIGRWPGRRLWKPPAWARRCWPAWDAGCSLRWMKRSAACCRPSPCDRPIHRTLRPTTRPTALTGASKTPCWQSLHEGYP